ncbi:TPA: hypothetical protein DEP06_05415, partial [Candidatus Daviesbacteria bacterium]|nr:hypothetical protein [Candidatus Daviesbacteria bacterium]
MLVEGLLGDEIITTLIKPVRLVTPETAQKFGIPTEAPMWVSPWISEENCCPHCERTFTPLVYQPHSIVVAQHFHPDNLELDVGISGRGGIYFSRALSTYHTSWGWVAECEPRGRITFYGDEIMSERAFVRGIQAFCAPCSAEDALHEGYTENAKKGPLEEGLVVSFQSDIPIFHEF